MAGYDQRVRAARTMAAVRIYACVVRGVEVIRAAARLEF